MNNKFVVDTSVAVKLFFAEEQHEQAVDLFYRAEENSKQLFAPSLIIYELNHVLVKKSATVTEVYSALALFQGLIDEEIIEVIPHSEKIIDKATEIAFLDTKGQGHISTYDATFHALALFNEASLITADKKYYEKTKDEIGAIVLLDEL